MEKIVIVSGYFNPLHKGHLELFQKALEKVETKAKLIVIVNSDKQRVLKGSKFFQDEEERVYILSNLRPVYSSIISIDQDKTQIETLKFIHNKYKDTDTKLYFANGGDQNNDSIPEAGICQELGISLIDGLGDKIQSSSWLLK